MEMCWCFLVQLWRFGGPGVTGSCPLSEDQGARRSDERLVEEIDDRRGEAEALDDLRDEGWAKGVVGGEGGGDAPLPGENEVDGGVVGEKALGSAGERPGVDGLHGLASTLR